MKFFFIVTILRSNEVKVPLGIQMHTQKAWASIFSTRNKYSEKTTFRKKKD
jgi:hypothetical protein